MVLDLGIDTFPVAQLWADACYTSLSEGVLTAKRLGYACSPRSTFSSTRCRAVASHQGGSSPFHSSTSRRPEQKETGFNGISLSRATFLK